MQNQGKLVRLIKLRFPVFHGQFQNMPAVFPVIGNEMEMPAFRVQFPHVIRAVKPYQSSFDIFLRELRLLVLQSLHERGIGFLAPVFTAVQDIGKFRMQFHDIETVFPMLLHGLIPPFSPSKVPMPVSPRARRSFTVTVPPKYPCARDCSRATCESFSLSAVAAYPVLPISRPARIEAMIFLVRYISQHSFSSYPFLTSFIQQKISDFFTENLVSVTPLPSGFNSLGIRNESSCIPRKSRPCGRFP